MKRKTLYQIFAILITTSIFFAACTKEVADTKLDPKLATTQAINLKSDSATIIGLVIATGDGFTERGVCYDIETAPTTAKTKVIYSGESTKATFTVKVGSLAYATKYYARAYGITASETVYGDEITFTTLSIAPTVTTSAITAITGNSASGGGNVTISGGASVTARGICFGTSRNPTVSNSKTTDASGTGVFVSTLSDLKGNTVYYVRAYAANSVGTSYGSEVQFTTLIDYPVVTTSAITEITDVAGKSGGNITSDGGSPIIARGIVYSTSPAPTLATGIDITDPKDTLGSFTASITGLTKGTKYYVRAYASNDTYTAYGNEQSFTPMYPASLFMIGNGVGGWDWATIDLPMIPVNSHANLFWKIVWMEATGGFKFAPQKAWGGDFGKTGNATAGVYDKGSDDIPVPGTAGYYMVVVDLAIGKIAIADPKVYLIGDVMGGVWDTANANGLFTVDNANSVVTITKAMSAGNIRMYAWHPWFTDWWQSEFVVLNSKIAFRGTGNDQTPVPVSLGSHTVNLNFKTGDGSIQ